MKRQTLQRFPMVILIMICLWIASTWVFARFVHYHAQRSILPPPHYTAEVIPVTGGASGNRELGDFRTSEDGRYYVRVATLGTAHHIARTTSDLLPPFVLALAGVVITGWIQRKQSAEPNEQVQTR